PRTESGHARIVRVVDLTGGSRNVYWEVTTAENVTHVYGKTASARITHPDFDAFDFEWLLEESRDTRGNVVRYEYKAEDFDNVPSSAHESHRRQGLVDVTANRYLKRILYANEVGVSTPSAAADFHFEVVFDYGEHDEASGALPSRDEGSASWPARQDPFSSYRAGFEVRTYRLCRRVLVFHRFSGLQSGNPTPVAALELGYDEDPVVTKLTSVTHRGYDATEHPSGTWEQTLPTVTLSYSPATLSSDVMDLDAASVATHPHGVDGRAFQWVDLDGEGVPGVLSQQGTSPSATLSYRRNLGQGKLAPPQTLATRPNRAVLAQSRAARAQAGGGPGLSARPGYQQLRDVTGDGLPDLVDMGRGVSGYHARTTDGGWQAHRSFATVPNVDFQDPSLRFIDLDGDGFADILMTRGHVYTWYPSLRDQGFGAPRTAPRWTDERRGPRLVFSEAQQTVFLADMTGDGLVDLVRVENGRVCYWPNLGYGRFGARVTMTDAPRLDYTNLYRPARVRLADVDGSGPADVLYIRDDGVWLWRNQAGNGFSAPEKVAAFPGHDALSTVDVIDVLGTGTASLVWSTPLQGRPPKVRYVDLHAGHKPHLLVEARNGLGLETRIGYTTSTLQYLADRAQGVDWLTRVPFPVHVVDRVEHFDQVTKHRFVSTYRFRHGFYDPEEREFRGFAYVEQ
ncbi:MAG: SpvB/TcaC N-terminal domain-containing protein, partial [Polyangiaceae bacterium]